MQAIRKRICPLIKKYHYILWIALPFIGIDIFMRILLQNVNYATKRGFVSSCVFSAVWIALFLVLILSLKSIIGKIFYWLMFAIYLIMLTANGVYYQMTGYFFGFHLVLMAKEGAQYIGEAVRTASPLLYVAVAAAVLFAIIGFVKIPKNAKTDFKAIGLWALVLIGIHTLNILVVLGSSNSELKWDTWNNKRDIYNNFNDSNKCMKICGIYEYVARDFYITFLQSDNEDISESDKEFLETAYRVNEWNKENEYTGLFEGKNIIFLQMEGMDTWLLNETDTPVLYELMQNSINFENHYSYYCGGVLRLTQNLL